MKKRRIVSSAERFTELLSEVRDFQIELGNQQVSLVFLFPANWDSQHPPFDASKKALLCKTRIPYSLERKQFTFEGDAFVCGFGDKNRAIGTSRRPYDWDPESREFKQLQQLFRRAGAALPVEYTGFLSNAFPQFSSDQASNWVALLLFIDGGVAFAGEKLVRQDKLVISHVLQLSRDLIEYLRLNTDAPMPLQEIQQARLCPSDPIDVPPQAAVRSEDDQKSELAGVGDTPAKAGTPIGKEQSSRKNAASKPKSKPDCQLTNRRGRKLRESEIDAMYQVWKAHKPRAGVRAKLKEQFDLPDEVATTLANRFRRKDWRIKNATKK